MYQTSQQSIHVLSLICIWVGTKSQIVVRYCTWIFLTVVQPQQSDPWGKTGGHFWKLLPETDDHFLFYSKTFIFREARSHHFLKIIHHRQPSWSNTVTESSANLILCMRTFSGVYNAKSKRWKEVTPVEGKKKKPLMKHNLILFSDLSVNKSTGHHCSLKRA